MGILPRTGTLSIRYQLSCTRPPSTTIAPSSTITLVSRERLSVITPAICGVLHAGDFLVNRQFDGAAFADLWFDFHGQAHVAPLDRLEGINRGAARRHLIGELSGNEGHVLTNNDFRFLVVECQDVRRRKDIALGGGFQGAGERAKIGHLPNPGKSPARG